MGLNEMRKAKRRRLCHQKLKRVAILNPKKDVTPWQHLFESVDTDSMVTTTGFALDTFDDIQANI